MLINVEKVKNIVVEPMAEEELRPLLLFRGNLSYGRARSVLNFLRAAQDAELPSMTEMSKFSAVSYDSAHLCGLHAKFGLERMGLRGYFGRVLQSPTILQKFNGLEEYLYWVLSNSREPLYRLDRISETSIWSKRDWRRVKPPRKACVPKAGITEYYPFISTQPTEDHALLMAVESLVPKGLLSDTRADICQDMLVAVLSGEVDLENLKDSVPKYIKQFFKQAPSKYGHLSLDAPIGDDGFTVGQTIAAEYR